MEDNQGTKLDPEGEGTPQVDTVNPRLTPDLKAERM